MDPDARTMRRERDESRGERLTPERVAELRRRVREREYESPQIAEEIARRLLELGDV